MDKNETEYLLSNPVNAEHLRKSLKEADEGDLIKLPVDEEVQILSCRYHYK